MSIITLGLRNELAAMESERVALGALGLFDAWVSRFPEREVPAYTHTAFHLPGPEQTNNRAELFASIPGRRAVLAAQPLRVVTDSKYVFDGVTTHLQRWLLLGWQQHAAMPDSEGCWWGF